MVSRRQPTDEIRMSRKLRPGLVASAVLKAGIVEARRHRAAEQCELILAAGDEQRPLPRRARHDDLRRLARGDVVSDVDDLTAAAEVKHQHLDRVAEVMMEDL